MKELPRVSPFTKLSLAATETPLWVGFNPTFHRLFTYGLLLSDVAFYTCSKAWLLTRWRRYLLTEVSDAVLESGKGRPTMRFLVGGAEVKFSTPRDFHGDEMEFDRNVLSQAVALLNEKSGITGA